MERLVVDRPLVVRLVRAVAFAAALVALVSTAAAAILVFAPRESEEEG